VLFRYRAYGRENVPADGGFIVAPNHGSMLDGFMFGLGLPRPARFMVGAHNFRWPVMGWILRWGGGFPVSRGETGRPALEVARRVLARGQGLIIFMEGALVRTPELGIPHSGLAVLALQTGAPVVPVAAYGAKPAWVFGRRRWWWSAKTTIVWGAPLRFTTDVDPAQELVTRVRDEIWSEIGRLHDLARELHEQPGGRPRRFVVPPRRRGDGDLSLADESERRRVPHG
jgi:1-acyl-sn-glycerol-3-phosphate acyltransferase